ncbi:MAG: hypothetical protein ACFNVQ_01375 [Campylobacter sp.]
MSYRAANIAPCIYSFEIYAVKFCPANLYRRILRLGILLGRICIAEFYRVEFCLKILRRKIPLQGLCLSL